MKKVIVFAIALLSGAFLNAKTNCPELTATYQQDEKQKFRDEMNNTIEGYRKDMVELRRKLKEDKTKFDAKVEKRLDDLEARNQRLKEKVNSYDAKKSWTNFKEEVKHDSDELGKAIKDFFKDNK